MLVMARKKRKIVKYTPGNPWPKLLCEFRERHQLTQEAAAALAKVTRRAWINWENGDSVPSRTYAHLLSLVIEKHNKKTS